MKRLTKADRQVLNQWRNGEPDDFRIPEPRSGVRLFALNQEGQPQTMLRELVRETMAGDLAAASELVDIALDLASLLELIARENPAALASTARRRSAWPVVALAREAQSPRVKDVFSRIKLGEQLFVELDPATAKWKMDRAGEIALALLTYVYTRRCFCCGWIGQKAKSLPEFCDDSAPAWWELAQATLLASYPKPDQVKELSRLITNPKWQTPGRKRARILDVLKARFISLAPSVKELAREKQSRKAARPTAMTTEPASDWFNQVRAAIWR